MTRLRMESRCWGEGEKLKKKIKRNNKSRCTYLGLVSPTKGLGLLILVTVQGIISI